MKRCFRNEAKCFVRASLIVTGLLLTSLCSIYALDPTDPPDTNIITVFDGEVDNEPLTGVNVHNITRSYYSVTNNKGQINIEGLAAKDTLLFEYLSYRSEKIAVETILNQGNKVYMHPDMTMLGVVTISSYAKQVQRSDDIPPIVEVIGKNEIEFTNPQTSADMLSNSGNVFIQKSQMGGGSPIIRGFEANKLLLVLDGVRMNNAIYRSGHLQNVISVDNSILDKTEIIYGPASIIYGSDALGGVMHFYTKTPKFQADGDKNWEMNAMTRFASANAEKTGHFDFSYGNEKWAYLLSASYSDYGDMLSGKRKHKFHPEGYGERPFYSEHLNFADSVFVNPNPYKQIGTAFGQIDLVGKFRYRPKRDVDLMLNVQYSTSTNIPRYDQLTEGDLVMQADGSSSFDFKFAEWYYGPQSRLLASLSANIESEENIFDQARIIAAYQKINEDRITRNFGDKWQNYRFEDVSVYSLNADMNKQIISGLKLLYGTELTVNRVTSTATRKDLTTSEYDERIATRYPDGGSYMVGAAAYVNAHAKLKKDITLMGGIRYSFITLSARFVDTTFINAPYKDGRISLETPALTASLGMAWNMGKGYSLHTVASNAFRAPNVDDVGKIRSKNGFVTLPTPDPEGVTAEKSLNAEVSLVKTFNNKLKISGTYFYTYLFDAIIRQRDSLADGSLTIYYDGSFDSIQSNINTGEAFIHGISGSILANITEDIQLKTTANYVYGHNISRKSPLAHIPPLYGMTSLNYKWKNKGKFELVTRFNGWKHVRQYADDSSDNFDKATPDGTPPWYTLNFYSAFNVGKSRHFKINFGIENILDHHYRPFSSGISAAGRNFMLGLHGKF